MQARLSFSTILSGILALMRSALDAVKPGSAEEAQLWMKASREAHRRYQAQGDIRNAIAHRSSPAKRAKLRARRR